MIPSNFGKRPFAQRVLRRTKEVIYILGAIGMIVTGIALVAALALGPYAIIGWAAFKIAEMFK